MLNQIVRQQVHHRFKGVLLPILYMQVEAFSVVVFLIASGTYAKILHQLSDDIEVTAGVGRADLAGRKILYIEPLVGARYEINENFSLSFEIGNAKDSKVANTVDVAERRLGIRYNF